LPAEIADIAYQNKAVVYDLLFRISAETMLTIAADPEHLGARIAITSVLHTLYGEIFVKGVPQGSYPFSFPSVSLFDLIAPFLRPDPRDRVKPGARRSGQGWAR
jgi:hypothetical protein